MSPRSVLVALAALLPAGRLKNAALRWLGWDVGPDVHMGPCLVFRVDHVVIGAGSTVGPFNVFRDLASLELGRGAQVGQWNWVSASNLMRQAGGPGTFVLGLESALTSRHYVDCTGGVRIGAFTAVGGHRSTFISHGVSWVTSDQTFGPIEIGDYCLISSNVSMTPGTFIGDRIVVGMGSTVSGHLTEPGLYAQPRATLVKRDLIGEYFHRERGVVDSVRSRS